jgi:tetratricopeptide (TPR) repeat protein
MLKLWGNIFTFILLSISLFGMDFERVCNEEVLKEDFNVSVVKESCLKVAHKYEEKNNMDDASWYYLIANQTTSLDKIEKNIQKSSSVIYANLGHFYLLKKNWKKVNKYYEKFKKSYQIPNKSILEDFKTLKKIYPKYHKEIKKAQKIWSNIYKPLRDIDTLYQENTIRSLLKIIKIKKCFLGKNTFSIINDYSDLGDLSFLNKDYQQAIGYFNKRLTIELFHLGEKDSQLSVSYQNLAVLHELNHQIDKSIENYKKILVIEESLDNSSLNIAMTHYHIGKLLKLQGEYLLAESSYIKALEIYKDNGKQENIAMFYNDLANIYSFQAEYQKSLKLYKKALKINTSILGENHPDIAINHNNIGQLLDTLRDSDGALKEYEEALKILIFNKYHENHKDFAMIYNNIATILAKQGDYEASLALFKKSLGINIHHYSEYSIEATANYNNIAYLLSEMGQEDKTLKTYQKLIKIYQKLYPNRKHPNLAIIYNSMVSTMVKNAFRLKERGESKKAKAIYTEALILSQKAIDINLGIYKTSTHPNIANSYSNVASILMLEGKYIKAEAIYIKALGIYASTLEKDDPKIAQLYNSLATLYTATEEYDKAIKLYIAVEMMWEKNYGKEHRSLVNTYHNMSALHYNQKKFYEAYVYINKSFKLFLQYRDRYFLSLSTQEKSNYIRGNKHLIRFSFLLKMGIFYRFQLFREKNLKTLSLVTTSILKQWLNYKGTLFEYQNILSMVKNNPNTPKEVINTINKLNQLNTQLSNTKEKGEEKKIEEKIHQVEIELSKKNESLKRILNLNDINTTQIANHLEPHQLYIDFARGNDNYYIFTLDKQNNISFQQIDENRSKKIDQNIKIYRENTKDMANKLGAKTLTLNYEKASNKKAKNILSQLYNDLIEEYLKEIIKGKTNFIISPDGLLNYFPFEALYHKGKYLVEDYTINYISSGKEFVRQTKLKPKQPKREMILFANADFNAKLKAYTPHKNDSTLAPRFGNRNEVKLEKVFAPLGRGEIDAIKEYYTNPLILENKNATIKALMGVPSSRILHLSTHGLFLEDKKILNPMKQSVLIFAGGNENLQQSTISALQLSALDLQDTELVVLSACQSGLGEIQNAEGVVGLPKALSSRSKKCYYESLDG